MTEPIDRLRSADPARGLGDQPDARGEADLRLLLAEPQRVAAPVPRPERRRLAPVLVTAFVALAVIALTAAVLGVVHPRTDVGGATPAVTPTLGSASCHPAQVLPFQCGTYESTYGGKAITGDLGGPAKDRLSISFTQKDGALLLSASTQNCFAEQVLVRVEGSRLVRVGTPTYSENDCHGPGVDTRSWAYAFLNGPLDHLEPSGPYFGKDATSVFFEFQGAAPLGAKQLPRNDLTCVPAHVAPFSCSGFFSAAGTGSVAFLGTDLFRLSFDHINGQLTAELYGRCNALSVVLEPDGNTVVTHGGASTAMGCGGAPGAQDAAVQQFFSGTLTYRIAGDTIAFRSGGSTASFTSTLSACHPASSPLCGTYHSSGGSGSVGSLSGDGTPLTFGQDGSQLTATVVLSCGTRTYALTIDRYALRFRPLSTTDDHSCPEQANAQDIAADAFLRSGLTWRWNTGSLTLEKSSGAGASAEFSR